MVAVMVTGAGAAGRKGEVAGSLEEMTPEPKQMAILGHGLNQPLHGDIACGGSNGVPNKTGRRPSRWYPCT